MDRGKLKSLWSNRPKVASGSCQNELQQQVIQAFQESLGLESVGIYDNFFQLGGHSLSAMQLQSALSSRGFNVTLQQLFRAQTPEKISELLDQDSEVGWHPTLLQKSRSE